MWGTAAFLLLLPLVAMQFTREVNWNLSDFVVIGVMLLAACGTYELGARMSSSTAYRAAFGIAVVAGFLLVWINLAVGIIGNENNRANLMFGGVLMVGAVGALIARFQPHGMARALVAQALIAVIALVGGLSHEAVMMSAFFAALWLTSAGCFGKRRSSKFPRV